jgi:hypothetical protein
MIDLDRPTPGLAFSTPLLYSLEQPRSDPSVRFYARSKFPWTSRRIGAERGGFEREPFPGECV